MAAIVGCSVKSDPLTMGRHFSVTTKLEFAVLRE